MIKIIENQADVDRHIANPLERTYPGDTVPAIRAYNCGNSILVIEGDRQVAGWAPYNALPSLVTEQDKERLEELSFFPSDDDDGFNSFRFGSC